MLGYYAPYFFNNKESIASDLALFVEPTKRGGFVASKLIDAFIQWAKFKQCFEIVLGTTTGVNTNRVESFYEKKGFIKVGGLFKRGIK